MKCLNKGFILFVLFVVSSVVWAANDIRFNASVSNNNVQLGETFNLELTLEGDVDVNQIDLPSIDGFDIRYLGPSQRIMIINGQTTKSMSFRYAFFPLKEGQFKIPSFELNVEGVSYKTDPISIVVSGGNQKEGDVSEGNVSLEDRLFIRVSLPKNQVYIGEKLPVTVKLFVADLPIQDVQFPIIEPTGFTISSFDKPIQYTRTIDGIEFRVVEFNADLFPTRIGELKLGAVELNASMLYKDSDDQRRSIFGDSFFNGIFSSYKKQPIKLKAPVLSIDVVELPEKNKPENFSGAVGDFDFSASVGPKEVRVGDPLTLKMQLSGEANLKAIEFPKLEDKRFRVYEPSIKEVDGVKTFEQVVIPLEEDISKVPRLDFHYFNPKLNSYQVISQGPFDVTVLEAQEGQNFKMVGFEKTVPTMLTKTEKFGRDIIFIKDSIGALQPIGTTLLGSFQFYLMVLIYFLIWLGGFVYYFYQKKLKHDFDFQRRVFAFKRAKKSVSFMKKSSIDDSQVFYQKLYHVVRDYVADKNGLPRGEISESVIVEYFTSKKIPDKLLNRLAEVLKRQGQARFASLNIPSSTYHADIDVVDKIIHSAEKKS